MDYEKLQKELYSAFLQACHETGDSYKKLSWFAKNHQKEQLNDN